MARESTIEATLKILPSTPGVYLMKSSKDHILYVGKSVNLKSRVSSYFRDSTELTFAKKLMVDSIRKIDWIETRNELEALVLETNLIKEHRPKYNILMKDDKNLAYLVITKWPVPEFMKVRNKSLPGEYFGPYASTVSISKTLKALRRIFKIRSCRVGFGKEDGRTVVTKRNGKSIPCMDYYIKTCPGPCLCSQEALDAHANNLRELSDFLKGRSTEVIERLRTAMFEKAKSLEFERAQELKERVQDLIALQEKQYVRDALEGNYDAVALVEHGKKWYVAVGSIRDGRLNGVYQGTLEDPLEEGLTEVYSRFLQDRYVEMLASSPIPHKLTVLSELHAIQNEPADEAASADERTTSSDDTHSETGISEAVSTFLRDSGIRIKSPENTKELEFAKFLKHNVFSQIQREKLEAIESVTLTRNGQDNILVAVCQQSGLWTPEAAKHRVFECYDISHTDGRFTVASRVVVRDGKSDNSNYKKYRIKSLADGMIDDYASHREVMFRRAQEAAEKSNLPDLIIIDGGKWQLSSAISGFEQGLARYLMDHPDDLAAIEKAKLTRNLLRICSLAKREELVFVPGTSEPVKFAAGTEELRILQLARDESHRFAITFNREKRTKEMKQSILDELPGFGPKTKKKLLKLIGSVDRLKEHSTEELRTALSQAQIQTLVDHGFLAAWQNDENS